MSKLMRVVAVREGGVQIAALFSDLQLHRPQEDEFEVGDLVEFDGEEVVLFARSETAIAGVWKIAADKRHSPYYPEVVESYARSLGDQVEPDDSRVDLLHLPFVTIDNEDSRDLDQAMAFEETSAGVRLWYALADPVHDAGPGTPVFAEALRRGASFYYPGFSIAMLPPALSEGLVSLNPDVIRRALVFEIEIDEEGAILRTELMRAFVRSRAKLSYDQVQVWFDSQRWPDEEWVASLVLLRRFGEARLVAAAERDLIEFQRYEPRITLTEDGARFVIGVRRRNEIERWNEQVSVTCNTEGARLLEMLGHDAEDLHAIFRVHLPPLRDRIRELEETLDGIADAHDLPEVWRWKRNEESLANYVAALPDNPELARLRRAVDRQVRWVNRASEFTERAGPHFALGVDRYARFTAPMREIVGIFTHKEALEALKEIEPVAKAVDMRLREDVIQAANEANRAQKQVDKDVMLLAIKQFLNDDLDLPVEQRPVRRGTVIGVRSTRAYVLLDEFPIDLKIYLDDLERVYEPVAGGLRSADSSPDLLIGSGVDLRVTGWNEERRRFLFEVLSQVP